MTPIEFQNIYRELIDENPLAIRAVLKVLTIDFTDTVATLAVTCEPQPRLLVNLGFVAAHCLGDAEVKAVICHEFLHVLLRHTERFTTLTMAEHLALDAVINAIIHRTLGPEYSRMMSRYYAEAAGVARLLRPPTEREAQRTSGIVVTWVGLYAGRLVADDIRDLARDHMGQRRLRKEKLIGNHEADDGGAVRDPARSSVLREAIEGSLKAMNGDGIFRSPRPGVGAPAYKCQVRATNAGLTRWRRETYAVLKRYLEPDPRSVARKSDRRSFTLPVLSSGDRRAALRAIWSPFLPEAQWELTTYTRAGSAAGLSRRQRVHGR